MMLAKLQLSETLPNACLFLMFRSKERLISLPSSIMQITSKCFVMHVVYYPEEYLRVRGLKVGLVLIHIYMPLQSYEIVY